MSGRRVANAWLGDLLAEAGWSGAELARAVNALGTLHGLALRYDRTAVAHWLSGTRPRRPVPELIAAALTERCGRLVTVAEAGLGASSAGPGVRTDPGAAAAEAGGEGLLRLALQARADVDPHGRPPLLRSPYQPVPVPPALWDREPEPEAEPDPAAGGPGGGMRTRTGAGLPELAARRHLAAHAEQLRALAVSFSGLYLTHGGVHTRAALAAWLAQDAGAFAARHTDGPRSAAARGRGAAGQGCGVSEVWRGYAQLAHLLGEMTADAGYHGLAQEYHGIALGLARQAGDRRMYAITLRAMSAHAGRLGQSAHAVRLARTAVETAPADGDPGTLAFLLVQRAAAHAHAGQRSAATADLAAADRLHGRHALKPSDGPFDSYARADLDFARARTHLALGEFPAAADALERSLRGRAAGQHRATALTHAALAETLLRLGHLTRACEHWRAFLTAAPAVQSRAVREALGRLLRDLTPYRRMREAVPTVAMARALADRLP
ncbi:hypothetical protein OG898_11205 [Streptomyces sp. NBC_00193]|uniref:hypothetical protein n=1 Tax=unclassified Streptomyces TaxID=2593676 RepID=UPI002255A84E|nr:MULTISPECIES: hypothetical protein [unclassified Streptomyces]MCX5123812.1 hypothetical protein [Streptomyces sp. NBC_00347]MCX5297057.1 hypothetical protein [Streptomyces sp. NBC_00193]